MTFRPAPWQTATLLVLGFIVVTAWWLSQDARIPDWDSGDHLQHAFYFHSLIDTGQASQVIKVDDPYVPFVEIVGALGVFVGGLSVASVVMTQNLIFVPLLALGCYGAARVVAGPRAGLLAVVFALGTPIIGSEFHEFLIDPALAAMVALTVWLLLASDRFRDTRYSLWAGGAAGVGMLTKQTFAFYIVGLVAVMLVRGGWREWRHVLGFAGVGLAVCWGYYVYHFDYLRGLAHGYVAGDTSSLRNAGLLTVPGPDNRIPPTWSTDNLLWYLWAVLNHVLLLPYALLAGGGAIAGLVEFVRRPRRESLVPELVGGLVIGWVLMTLYFSLHDVRYILPTLVYAAVLATAWIVRLPRPWTTVATGTVAALAALNFAAVTFGLGSRIGITLPGAPRSELGVGRLTLYSPEGFLVSKPQRAGDMPAILRRARRQGVQSVAFDPGGSTFFNSQGLWALSEVQDFPPPAIGLPTTLGPRGLYVFTRPPTGRFAHPCLRAADGTPVFMAYGGQKTPVDQWALTCIHP